MDGCLACDLATGRVELPGGEILVTDHWIVEHCVGPLGVGLVLVTGRSTRQRLDSLAASVPLALVGFGGLVLAGFGG